MINIYKENDDDDADRENNPQEIWQSQNNDVNLQADK